MGTRDKSKGKGLYLYSVRELSRFLKEIGYPGYSVKWPGDITRNSDGTALRFMDWRNRKGIVVTCDGSIKELSVPGEPAWFNDQHQAIAWLDKGTVYYKTGMTDQPPFMADYRADSSGRYFMKDIPSPIHKFASVGTAIHSIERPDVPLANVSVLGERVFVKNDKVLLFGSNFANRDKYEKLVILQERDNQLVEIEKVMIRRPEESAAPFSVEDLSPWNDEVLFVDVYDFPFRSKWYVFNLKTHEMKKIGKLPPGGGWGFYLQCDIIKQVAEKLRDGKVKEGRVKGTSPLAPG